MLRERVEQRWQDPDVLLPAGVKTREETRLRVVTDVAAQRFEFPTPEFPNLRTYVNLPEASLVIRTAEGQELAPDIVVAERPNNAPRILAQVVTSDMVSEAEALRSWLPCLQVPDTTFYLYVPSGHGSAAKAIVKKLNMKKVGLRTWRYVAGQDALDITEMDYGFSLVELLLPPFMLNRHRPAGVGRPTPGNRA